jgi:hypothetical protein
MAVKDYTKPQATADRLITKYGKTGAIRRATNTGTAHDPTISETDYPAIICTPGYNLTNRDATLIQTGDKVGLIAMSGLAITPTMADKIVIEDTVYSFIDLQPLRPAGTTLMYEFHARRG